MRINMKFMNPTEVRAKLDAKNTKFVSVRFIKKNGEERKMSGLLKPHSKIKGTGRGTPAGYIAIYSPNEEKWGMFSVDKVLEVR
jgi:hypothetical protein